MGLERRQSGPRNARCAARGQEATFPQRQRLQGSRARPFPRRAAVPRSRRIWGPPQEALGRWLELGRPEEQSCLSSDRPRPGAGRSPSPPTRLRFCPGLCPCQAPSPAGVAGDADTQTRASPPGTCSLSGIMTGAMATARPQRSRPWVSPAGACTKPRMKHVTYISDENSL